MAFRKTTEQFIEKARAVHGDKYDYSKVVYLGNKEKVNIICPDHGEFAQIPSNHTSNKRGCPECGKNKLKEAKRKTTEQFIEEARAVHGDKYDYSKVVYFDSHTDVIIICPDHGEFPQAPATHLANSGCIKCINKSEGRIAIYLENKGIVHRRYRIKNKEYDFYLPEHNLIIERDGEQHYRVIDLFAGGDIDYLAKQQANDRFKTELAKESGIRLARIPFWLSEEQEIQEINNILNGEPTYPDVPKIEDVLTQKPPKEL